MERLIDIYDQGRLAGVLHLPHESMLPCPVIIYCPGKNGERYEVHRLAVKFARRLSMIGIAFLRFDYYGVGLSDGFYHEMTTSKKISNAVQAWEQVTLLPEIEAGLAAFLGFSDGARVAMMAANRTGVGRLVMWSPLFYEIGGNFPGNKRPRFVRHAKDRNALVVPWAGLWVGMEFYQDLQSLPIDREIQNYSGRSLVVHSDNDPLLLEEFEMKETHRLGIFQHSYLHQVHVIPDGGHLFTSVYFEQQLMGHTEQWLRSEAGFGLAMEGNGHVDSTPSG